MNLPTPTKRNAVLAGAAAAIIAAVAGGAVLAVHSAGASAPLAAVTTPSPSAAATPTPGKMPHHKAATARMVLELRSATATSLTAVDSHGTASTFVLGKHLKVVSAAGSTEQLASIPAGEILVVEVTHPTPKAAGGTPSPAAGVSSSSSSTSSAAGGGGTGTTQPTVVAIEDSGFAAR